MICRDCGKLISLSDGKNIDGEFICNDYIDKNYIKCADCGKYHKKDNMYYIEDTHEWICQSCYECNGYFYCEECGRYYSKNHFVFIEDAGRYVCEGCAKNKYYQCYDCGRWFESVAAMDEYRAEMVICNGCWESGRWNLCHECGCLTRIEDGNWGDDEYFYCNDCFEYFQDNIIKQYHSFNDWDFRIEHSESIQKDTYFYGFEIEVSGDRECAEETNSLLAGRAVLMQDGSVKGFEIVTDPMTKDYYYNSFLPILEDTMEYLKESNFTGHNAGGIHIHVSKEACNNWEAIRTLLNYNNIDLWVKLTQREQDKLQQWARLYSEQFDGKDTRYQALNYDDRTKTYEFRIFNSNLRVERITKNFEVVLSLIDFANNNIVNSYTDIKRYIKFVEDNKKQYENLYNFMIEKKIIKENILIKASNKIAEVLQLCA